MGLLLMVGYLTLHFFLDQVECGGYSVMKASPRSGRELTWLEEASPCSLLPYSRSHSGTVDLLCNRRQAKQLTRQARERGVPVSVVARNVGNLISQELKDTLGIFSNNPLVQPPSPESNISSNPDSNPSSNPSTGLYFPPATNSSSIERSSIQRGSQKIIDHHEYEGYHTIMQHLEHLQERFPQVALSNIGRTHENRQVRLVTVNGGHDLPVIFIDAGIHAREWISPASTLYFLDILLKKSLKRKSLTDQFEWQIIPLTNPDGYEYTRSGERHWRKNRRPLPGSKCKGVDLNRNFPEGYGVGASKNPCSEVYQGPSPFSEDESTAIKNHIEANSNRIQAAVSVHSFGNVLIYPWGYKVLPHPHRDRLADMARVISDKIFNKTNERYNPGTSKEVFGDWGLAGGATDDYYITKGIPYSFTLELPEGDDSGNHGFELPPSNIKRVGRQVTVAMLTLAAQLSHSFSSGSSSSSRSLLPQAGSNYSQGFFDYDDFTSLNQPLSPSNRQQDSHVGLTSLSPGNSLNAPSHSPPPPPFDRNQAQDFSQGTRSRDSQTGFNANTPPQRTRDYQNGFNPPPVDNSQHFPNDSNNNSPIRTRSRDSQNGFNPPPVDNSQHFPNDSNNNSPIRTRSRDSQNGFNPPPPTAENSQDFPHGSHINSPKGFNPINRPQIFHPPRNSQN